MSNSITLVQETSLVSNHWPAREGTHDAEVKHRCVSWVIVQGTLVWLSEWDCLIFAWLCYVCYVHVWPCSAWYFFQGYVKNDLMFRGRMGLSVHHVTFLTVTQSWFNRPYIVGVHRWPLLTLLIPRMWFWRWVHSGWHMCDLAWVKHLNEPMGTAEQMSGCRLIFNCDFLRSFDPLCRSFGTFSMEIMAMHYGSKMSRSSAL